MKREKSLLNNAQNEIHRSNDKNGIMSFMMLKLKEEKIERENEVNL